MVQISVPISGEQSYCFCLIMSASKILGGILNFLYLLHICNILGRMTKYPALSQTSESSQTHGSSIRHTWPCLDKDNPANDSPRDKIHTANFLWSTSPVTSVIHQCKQRKGHLQKHLRKSAFFVVAEQVADVLVWVPSSFLVVAAPSWWMLLEMALNWQLKASPVGSSLKVAPRDPHFASRKFYGQSQEATWHDPADSANFVSRLHPPALSPLSGWNAGFASPDLGSH